MRSICLFLRTNKVKTRVCHCQTHPHFIVNSSNSFLFHAFNFCQSRKPILAESWRCKSQHYIDGFDTNHWLRFAKHIPSQKPSKLSLENSAWKNRSFRKSMSWAAFHLRKKSQSYHKSPRSASLPLNNITAILPYIFEMKWIEKSQL